MAQQTIGVGTAANDGTGDALRTAFQKVNSNFDEVYAAGFVTSARLNSDVFSTAHNWTASQKFLGTAASWTIPTLNSPGYLPPLAAFATENTSAQGMVIAACSSAGNATLTMMASAGTLASPSEQTGAGTAINFMNYVGGSVAAWRTFAVIEAGNRGGPPTAEGHVLGRIQLGACNGSVSLRPGVVVYNDSLTLTDKLPLRIYNSGHANVFDGITSDYERIELRWTTSGTATAILGTAKAGTGTSRNLQIEVGGIAVAEFNGGTGFMLPSDYILAWSAATATLGSSFTNPDVRLFRTAAKILRLDGSSGGAALHMLEMTAPSAPASDGGYLYLVDNAGKTELRVLFSSGASQLLAAEP